VCKWQESSNNTSKRPYEPVKVSLCAQGHFFTNEPYKEFLAFKIL
jgi:hypothetical protein